MPERAEDDLAGMTDEPVATRSIPASDRRRAVEMLLGLWTDVARDLVLVSSGGSRSVHDTVLLEELSAIARSLEPGHATAFLERSARAAEWLAGNVSPELILDSLVLAWPRRRAAAV
jgi:hypothetical protein